MIFFNLMTIPFYYIIAGLLAGLALIVLLTVKFRIHAFFALLLACFITGITLRLSPLEIINTSKEGFGNILKSLGLIIVLGTTLGGLLEHRGSTRVMADFILKKTGERHAAFALSLTGFIVGLPVFCDSGYIVLSGLNRPLAKRTGIPLATLSVSLATGLYAVHCLVPPHPGAAAAAGLLGVDFGKLILVGMVVAIPAMVAGHLWSVFAGRGLAAGNNPQETIIEKSFRDPSVLQAFLPVLVPVILIALKSFFPVGHQGQTGWMEIFLSLGDPVIALAIGVILAMPPWKEWKKNKTSLLLQESVEKAGSILVIIGAGGAFGAVLSAAKPAEHLREMMNLGSLGIFFPFLVASLLKTAQGSSTVAILTAASIVNPLLSTLGLDHENGRLLCVLAMGAGSMLISHANDAYFWVILKFSGLEMKTVGRVYTMATILMGLVSFLMVYLLSFILL
jgi:gluconate:H+ symporter, GntP family